MLILCITARMPAPSNRGDLKTVAAPVVWTRAARGGGDGGGGNRTPAPARRAEARRVGAVVAPATDVALQQIPPSLPMASMNDLPGTLSALPTGTISLGPGTHGIAGTGPGGGIGDGDKRGVGPGPGGDGVYGPTDGVTFPELVREVPPRYTPGALQARVEGLVLLQAVVNRDGTVGDVRVTRSLDRVFGLDDEAVRTVKQWQFRPGRKDGKPVAVVVPIELRFTIR